MAIPVVAIIFTDKMKYSRIYVVGYTIFSQNTILAVLIEAIGYKKYIFNGFILQLFEFLLNTHPNSHNSIYHEDFPNYSLLQKYLGLQTSLLNEE